MESLNPAPTFNNTPEKFELKLTITDGAGIIHELEIVKIEGQPPLTHLFGNNIKLVARLRMALQIMERQEGGLI